MDEQIKIQDLPNYDELNQRTAHPTAWLDEVLQAIELAVQDAVNESTIEGKNKVLLALNSYIAGIADGNRFMRDNPYKNGKSLPREMLKRVTHS